MQRTVVAVVSLAEIEIGKQVYIGMHMRLSNPSPVQSWTCGTYRKGIAMRKPSIEFDWSKLSNASLGLQHGVVRGDVRFEVQSLNHTGLNLTTARFLVCAS